MLCAPESLSNYFFQPFSTFLVHVQPFSMISHLKSRKNIWKRAKKVFFSVFVYSSELVDMQKLGDSLKGYLEIIFYWLIFCFCMSTSFEEKTKTEKTIFFVRFRRLFLISDVKSLKKVENEQKRLKTAEKSSLTSLWVRAAPKAGQNTQHISYQNWMFSAWNLFVRPPPLELNVALDPESR